MIMKARRIVTGLALLGLVMLLQACAGSGGAPERISPEPGTVAAAPERFLGMAVEWGGVIVGAENRHNGGWLEVVAYPLDGSGRPHIGLPPEGRFQGVSANQLELEQLTPGRRVKVSGVIREVRIGTVGGREHLFPLLEMHNVRVWSDDRGRQQIPVHLGIGFGVAL
jgi:outer membrane lipoprotein